MYLLSLPGEVGGSEAVLVEIDGDLLLLDLPHHVRGRLVTQCIVYRGGTGGPKKGDLSFELKNTNPPIYGQPLDVVLLKSHLTCLKRLLSSPPL